MRHVTFPDVAYAWFFQKAHWFLAVKVHRHAVLLYIPNGLAGMDRPAILVCVPCGKTF